MPDLTQIIQAGSAHVWLYLPVAIILGALHALEPGHAKSLMAAYIVSIRGTPGQAALLGLSAAVGHTIVVWALAIIGLLLGEKLIVDKAEPWLMLLSGVLVVLLGLRMLWLVWSGNGHSHDHDHHDGDHAHHDHDHDAPVRTLRVTRARDIMWFGFTGGLLPCPSAVAVLLVCIQLKQFTLGIAMVAAFSVGLAITLVSIGLAASWGARAASARWPWFESAAEHIPYLSAGIVIVIGAVMMAFGFHATGLIGGMPR
jgi:nickel/cobalt exporter